MYATHFSDGFSSLPLTQFYGDPAISSLSNLSIDSIKGNADLTHANVICLSDIHGDDVQIEVRANIVKEIIKTRGFTGRIFFLLEGLFVGEVDDGFVFELLMGTSFDYREFRILGWDDAKLHAQSMEILRGLQGMEYLRTENILKKHIISKDGIEVDFENIDYQDQKYRALIDESYSTISVLARRRDESKVNTIRQVRYLDPDALIFVVGGINHFNRISEEIPEIAHCAVNIKQFTPSSLDSFEKVYGFSMTFF